MHQKRKIRMQIPLSCVKYCLSKVVFVVFTSKMTTRQLNLKNKSYYFYNDLISILNFEASNLKLDKKTWKDLDIYYICYVDRKPEWSVNSANTLYLIINTVYGSISEKNGVKYLTIDKGDSVLKKYDQLFSGIKHHVRKIDDYEAVYNTDYDKIKFFTEDSIPLNKLIYFPTLNVVLRCVLF